ncbi:uncharacterized protein LOC128958599 [Oppia nitens]|uniref:uncharacterized protein LOC128958599 n=1 Tax=Oppia nitens TaxID=1686743 RepID=UPI0023D9EF53|nr:uncharacterized protein LOC128958599 [Oppia nitens]
MSGKVDKLLCFCHFCELHGPNVILTTHCVSKSDLLNYNIDGKQSDTSRTTSSLASSMSSLPTNSFMNNSNLFTDEIHMINDELNDRTNGCEGCSLKSKSMDGFNGFLSFSESKKFGFITNEYPMDGNNNRNSCDISNSIIRDACIRSLSCEVYDSSEGEGIIYFGDDQRAHILSCLFFLKDSKARGFQRTYSILVISRHKHELLNDWDFYVKHIKQIVTKLKSKAKIIYESELTQTTCQQRRSLILDNVSNIRANINSLEDIVDRNPLNTHRMNSKARSLLELTGDNTAFAYLHIQFSWILSAVFVLHSNTNSVIDYSGSNSIRLSPNLDQKLSLRNFYNVITKDNYNAISYNIVTGNKIIICDTNTNRQKAIIQCLSQLLPEECVCVLTDYQRFDESSKHNFIGVSSLNLLPKNIMDSEYHLLVVVKDKSTDKNNSNNKNNLFTDKTQIQLHSVCKLPDCLPNFLVNIENILTDLSYSDQTLMSYLMTSKNEWLNKAQAFYSYTKGVNPPRSQSEINAMFKLIGADDCDRKMITYWANNGFNIEYKTKVFSINSETDLVINGKQLSIK